MIYSYICFGIAGILFVILISRITLRKISQSKSYKNESQQRNEKKINFAKDSYKSFGKAPILYILVICATLIISVGIYSYFNYQKEVLKQEKEDERIKDEKEEKKLKQANLNNCITTAKNNRTNLWNQNCTTQSDGSCTIKNGTGTIEWIEKRYQQDLNNCYQLYGD